MIMYSFFFLFSPLLSLVASCLFSFSGKKYMLAFLLGLKKNPIRHRGIGNLEGIVIVCWG